MENAIEAWMETYSSEIAQNGMKILKYSGIHWFHWKKKTIIQIMCL